MTVGPAAAWARAPCEARPGAGALGRGRAERAEFGAAPRRASVRRAAPAGARAAPSRRAARRGQAGARADRRRAAPARCSGPCSAASVRGRSRLPEHARRGRAGCAPRALFAFELEVVDGVEVLVLVLVVLVVELVLVEVVLVVVERFVVAELAAGLAGELEALDQVVAPVLVDAAPPRRSAPSRTASKSAASKISWSTSGRVVDDDHDLGLRVEVRARAAGSARRAGSGARASSRVYTPSAGGRCAERASHGSSSLERARHLGARRRAPPCPGARAVRCAPTTSWRTSSTRPGRARRSPGRRRSSLRDLGVDVERRLAAADAAASLRAGSIWRISCSCSARAAASRRRRGAGGRRRGSRSRWRARPGRSGRTSSRCRA